MIECSNLDFQRPTIKSPHQLRIYLVCLAVVLMNSRIVLCRRQWRSLVNLMWKMHLIRLGWRRWWGWKSKILLMLQRSSGLHLNISSKNLTKTLRIYSFRRSNGSQNIESKASVWPFLMVLTREISWVLVSATEKNISNKNLRFGDYGQSISMRNSVE